MWQSIKITSERGDDMREIDTKAKAAANDSALLSDFIQEHDFFIIRTASKIAKRYITKGEDEYSIALIAFSEAVQKYDYNKGSFFSFAELNIRSSLIDYFRGQGKYSPEIYVEWIQENAFVEYNDNQLALEIEALTPVLKEYGFSWMDLTEVSPKAEKTKAYCAQAIQYLLKSPILLSELKNTKLLPIKILEKKIDLPRKLLDRHRKYIIAAVEILEGDYPYLADYLRHIKEID